jgi:hypothetical protein
MQVVKDRSMSATNVNPSVAETAFRARSMRDSGSFTVTRKRWVSLPDVEVLRELVSSFDFLRT